jgi:hypothetical protein
MISVEDAIVEFGQSGLIVRLDEKGGMTVLSNRAHELFKKKATIWYSNGSWRAVISNANNYPVGTNGTLEVLTQKIIRALG